MTKTKGFAWGEDILSVDPATGERSRLIHSSTLYAFTGLSWSPDGTRLAFAGEGFSGRGPTAIYTMRSDGGRRALRGTGRGETPVFSPDGERIAFSRCRCKHRRDRFTSAVWLVRARGGRPRRLTHWRSLRALAPAGFSPDGRTVLAERVPLSGRKDVVAIARGGGAPRIVVRNATEPALSPDGQTIAFVRPTINPRGRSWDNVIGSDLYLASLDGSIVRRLTFDPKRRDEHPDWDPSGERIAYAKQTEPPPSPELTWGDTAIRQINADGTCDRRILYDSDLLFAEPTWQRGPGREAGRISC